MTGTVEFVQKIRYVEITDENGEQQVYAIPETVENVQELIRCKDCKHILPKGFCHKHSRKVTDDFFCADGERRRE